MESPETIMATSNILPLQTESSCPSLSNSPSEVSSDIDAASTQTHYSQGGGNGSDAGPSTSSLTPDSQTDVNSTITDITLLPSEPTTPITSPEPLSSTSYKLLAAHHPTTGLVYKIQAIPGKGLGMIATAVIPCGTRLMAETPIMTLQRRDWVYESTQREAIITRYLTLPPSHRQLFDALHPAPPRIALWLDHVETEYMDAQPFGPDDDYFPVPFEGQMERPEQARACARFSTNSFGVDDGAAGHAAACCPESSRLNHSCAPNVQFAWNDELLGGGALTLHATRTILPGEELCVGYVDLLEPSGERQAMLRDGYGFACGCGVCGSSEAGVQLSDWRRKAVREGVAKCKEERDEAPWWREVDEAYMEELDYLAGLLADEGLTGLQANTVFNLGITAGATPSRFATKALAVVERCLGTDHPNYRRTKRHVEQFAAAEEARRVAREWPVVNHDAGDVTTAAAVADGVGVGGGGGSGSSATTASASSPSSSAAAGQLDDSGADALVDVEALGSMLRALDL